MTHAISKPKRITTVLLLIVMLICAFPAYSFAATACYYVQSTFDTDTWYVRTSVVNTADGWFGNNPLETKRYTQGERSKLADATVPGELATEVSGLEEKSRKGGGGDDALPLTFPNKHAAEDKTAEDHWKLAQNVATRFTESTNTALDMFFPDRSAWSKSVLPGYIGDMLSAIKNNSTLNGVQISTVSNSTVIGSRSFSVVYPGEDPSNYRLLTKGDTRACICVKLLRGYDDITVITIDAFLFEAVGNLLDTNNSITIQNVDIGHESAAAETLAELLSTAVRSIENALQLWNIDDLIFSHGPRNTYVHGVFPAPWETYIWTFFIITEVISIVALLYSIIKAVLNRSLATANFRGRMEAWSKLESFFVTAILLAILPLFIQILMSLSDALTQIFYEALPQGTNISMSRQAGGVTALSAIVLNVMYLVMDIYFNFYYMLRAIMVAALIIFAPFAIVSISFEGSSYRGVFSTWVQNMGGYLFIQPIHAFLFVFILLLPNAAGRQFDRIIMMYSVIPISGFLRNLILPKSSDAINQAANAATGKTVAGARMAGRLAGRGVDAAGVAVIGGISGGIEGAREAKGKRDEAGNMSAETENYTRNTEKMNSYSLEGADSKNASHGNATAQYSEEHGSNQGDNDITGSKQPDPTKDKNFEESNHEESQGASANSENTTEQKSQLSNSEQSVNVAEPKTDGNSPEGAMQEKSLGVPQGASGNSEDEVSEASENQNSKEAVNATETENLEESSEAPIQEKDIEEPQDNSEVPDTNTSTDEEPPKPEENANVKEPEIKTAANRDENQGRTRAENKAQAKPIAKPESKQYTASQNDLKTGIARKVAGVAGATISTGIGAAVAGVGGITGSRTLQKAGIDIARNVSRKSTLAGNLKVKDYTAAVEANKKAKADYNAAKRSTDTETAVFTHNAEKVRGEIGQNVKEEILPKVNEFYNNKNSDTVKTDLKATATEPITSAEEIPESKSENTFPQNVQNSNPEEREDYGNSYQETTRDEMNNFAKAAMTEDQETIMTDDLPEGTYDDISQQMQEAEDQFSMETAIEKENNPE